MEQILNEILNGINSLRNDINALKTEHIKTNERLTTLELSQEKLKKKITYHVGMYLYPTLIPKFD